MPTDIRAAVTPRLRPRRPSRFRLVVGAVLAAPLMLVVLLAVAVAAVALVLFSILAGWLEG